MPYNSLPCKIMSVKNISANVKLFRVKTKINPQPGQFFEVSILGIGECPLASCSYNKNYVDILVRNAGTVTNALFKLKPKDTIHIRGPYGKGYPLEELHSKDIILAAGGTGIAPVTSLISYVEQNRRKFKKIEIYFGFRDNENILLKDKIKTWQKKFKTTVCLSQEENKLIEGCVKGHIPDAMKKSSNFNSDTVGVLCGPEPMMEAVTKKLNSLKIPYNKIFWSMERRMECGGLGNCGRCLIQDLYTCKDGPVFRYDIIKPRLENEMSSQKMKK